jgi:predicted ester cyclase
MTRPDIEALLDRHKAAFGRRDAAALATDHAPEGTFESPAHGVVRGRDGIRGVYEYWFSAFPDLSLTWTSVVIDGNRASFFWDFSGTTQGVFFGVDRPGTIVTMKGAAEYVFGDGEILSARHVFDFSGLLIKTGALKTKPA